MAGWLAFVVLATTLGTLLPWRELTASELLVGAPARAERILEAGDWQRPASEMVLVQPLGDTPAGAAATALQDLVDTLRSDPDVLTVTSPLDGAPLRSADGRSALVTVEVAGGPAEVPARVAAIQETVHSVADRHPDVRIEQFGGTSVDLALDAALRDDFRRAEYLAIPVTLAVLLLTFGALVAALLPLVFALTAFAAALGLLSLTSQVWPVNATAPTVMLLIGLAVGVDYSLFYLKREREERARGAGLVDALDVAAATSGRSVLVSGVTVIVAMGGVFLTGSAIFTGVGMATILVVTTSVAGSLTVLPALMSWLGPRVEAGRIPLLHRRAAASRPSPVWSLVLRPALRRPLVAALAAGLFLLALAAPATGLRLRDEGVEDLPQDLPVIQTLHRISEAFPGSSSPAVVVVEAEDVTTPAVQEAVARLREGALASGQANEPIGVQTNAAGTVTVVSIPLAGSGEDRASVEALATLTDDLVPATVGEVEGVTAVVTGRTAASVALRGLVHERTPWVFAFVLALAFALLMVAFRSLVVAAKAILLNLLSVGAAYGVLVLVFQHGWAASLIGLDTTGAIVTWVPLFLFVVLFGLSMDYHVFILSRIREGYDRGLPTRDAIAAGITSSAGVVTSAALIMVFVFATFVTLSTTNTKQIGLGLAVAVLLDATVVRAVLLPATMQLLGDANWYLPRWLQWLPVIRYESPSDPAAPPEAFPYRSATAHGSVGGRRPHPAHAAPGRSPWRRRSGTGRRPSPH